MDDFISSETQRDDTKKKIHGGSSCWWKEGWFREACLLIGSTTHCREKQRVWSNNNWLWEKTGCINSGFLPRAQRQRLWLVTQLLVASTRASVGQHIWFQRALIHLTITALLMLSVSMPAQLTQHFTVDDFNWLAPFFLLIFRSFTLYL